MTKAEKISRTLAVQLRDDAENMFLVTIAVLEREAPEILDAKLSELLSETSLRRLLLWFQMLKDESEKR